jgi:hypothetical protein
VIESLKKFDRMMRRDHFGPREAAIGLGIMAALGIGGAMFTLPIALAALCGAAGGGIFGLVFAGIYILRDRIVMSHTKDIDLGFTLQDGIGYFLNLKGPGRQISILRNTQKLIDKLTRKFNKAAALPPETLAQIKVYIEDAREAAPLAKLVCPAGNDSFELPRLEFSRKFTDAAGQEKREILGSVDLSYTPPRWEAERMLREEQERSKAQLEADLAKMQSGISHSVAVKRPLRLRRAVN